MYSDSTNTFVIACKHLFFFLLPYLAICHTEITLLHVIAACVHAHTHFNAVLCNCWLYLTLQKYNKCDVIHMVGKWIQYPVHTVNWAYLNSLVSSSCATCGENGHILIFLKIFNCSKKHFEDLWTLLCISIVFKVSNYKENEATQITESVV